jgi:hypothetical protein
MVVRVLRRAGITAALLAWPAFTAGQTSATAPGSGDRPGGRLLDVPYVAQSADLCGGAALAMVLRYWGDRTTVAEDFAPLVDPDEGGIRTGQLVEAARERGWHALPVPAATAGLVRSHVDGGRPTVALIEERPGVLHYVVIVAWTDTEVVAHDPARSPFRVLTHEEFDRRWAVSGRWLLLVLPAGSDAAAPVEPAAAVASVEAADADAIEPCGALVALGVSRAAAGNPQAAEQVLVEATERCPAAAPAWRELAGLRFVERRWPEAERLAGRAVSLAPGDEHAWSILAAARYQQSDWTGALRAMHATGAPPIDLIEVAGATRTPHPVVIGATGLAPRQPLTAGRFARAARRLADLPIATRSRLAYRPTATGAMTVEAVIAERDAWPRLWTDWAGVAARAAADGIVRVDLAGLGHSGDLVTSAWRWSPDRPLIGFRLATPAPGGLPGIAAVEGVWERQTYGPRADDDVGEDFVESRRRVSFLLSDWLSGAMRWETEAALDRFDGWQYATLGGAVEVHAHADRLALGMAASGWAAPASTPFSTGAIHVAWRSSASGTRPAVSVRSGVLAASARAPLALWPGAGTGQGRPPSLRAHPLLAGDVVTGDVFGRRVWHGTLEYARPIVRHPAANVAVVGFADAARAWHRRAGDGPSPAHVDVGAGVRIGTPGMRGSLDVNVAYGTRDGRVVVSAGVRAPWPAFGRWRDR